MSYLHSNFVKVPEENPGELLIQGVPPELFRILYYSLNIMIYDAF